MAQLPVILVYFLTPVVLYVVPALIARRLIEPIAFWLLSNQHLVSGPKIADYRIGPQVLLVLVGASVLILFPLIPQLGDSSL